MAVEDVWLRKGCLVALCYLPHGTGHLVHLHNAFPESRDVVDLCCLPPCTSPVLKLGRHCSLSGETLCCGRHMNAGHHLSLKGRHHVTLEHMSLGWGCLLTKDCLTTSSEGRYTFLRYTVSSSGRILVAV